MGPEETMWCGQSLPGSGVVMIMLTGFTAGRFQITDVLLAGGRSASLDKLEQIQFWHHSLLSGGG